MRPTTRLTAAAMALAAMIVSLPLTAALTADERALSRHAHDHAEAAVALLEEVVNVNSGTMNHAGVRRTADIFKREFESLGMATTWFDMSSVDRSGHLFAETEASGSSPCMLLIGHLDTVFEADDPFQTFRRDGDIAVGPGVVDMKGGNVVIVYALKALASIGALPDMNLIVALTGDEEKPGRPLSVSRRQLKEAAQRCDIALGFEYASGLDEATIARRGSSGWRLQVSGRQAHSSTIFSDATGSGAIFEAARILDAFHEQVRGERYLTFNPGMILGGTEVTDDPALNSGSAFGKTNVVARSVVVQGGLRTISREQELAARAAMRQIVESGNRPATSAQIEFSDGYPAMPPTKGNKALLAQLSAVSRDLGHGEVVAYDPGKRGAADISFVAAWLDAIDGLGAEGQGAHTPQERLDLATLPQLIERTAILIHRLGRQ